MKLLVIDDDRITRDLLREVFEKEGYEIAVASSAESALRALRDDAFPIVLSDIRMSPFSGTNEIEGLDGMTVLSHLKRTGSKSIVILMTGFGTMEGAIDAIQQGAFEYISKPFKLDELKSVVARARRQWEAMQLPASDSAGSSMPLAPKGLIGKSPKIVEVYRTLARATLSPSNVLILGESGTGKELVARAIHEHSACRKQKFVAVNCSAIAENLLESELFGHVKGSFTGAIANKTGLIEEAHEGTLFLDEIGDLSPALQVKLLRVIQEGEYKPVGLNESRHAKVRVIAATHRDLETSVAQGRFREDLYYRLKVIRIELPPLRERPDDIPELVSHFLARFSERIRKDVSHVSDEALDLLLAYGWPGNVRELEHAIERAVSMTRTSVLYPEDFPPEISRGLRSAAAASSTSAESSSLSVSLEAVEKAHIRKVLEDANFNKSRAATMLGIDRKTLHRKAQRYGIRIGPSEVELD